MSRTPEDLGFRPASLEDGPIILAWRNDPQTRAMSRQGEEIGIQEHMEWFGRALADERRRFLIAEFPDGSAGLVRFDRAPDGAWEVGINLNPDFRGRGLASHVLIGAILLFLEKTGPQRLTAAIRQSNRASRHIFERAGFTPFGTEEPDWLLYERA